MGFFGEYMTNLEIMQIGRLPSVNRKNDPDDDVRLSKEKMMRIVDIVPVYFVLDLANIMNGVSGGTSAVYKPVKLDFNTGIEEYRKKLDQVGLKTSVSGLRIWMSGESNSQEQVTNNYKDNKIVETYDKMLQKLSENSYNLPDWAKSFGKQTGGIGGTPVTAFMDGRQLSLPKIWNKSDFTANFTLSFRLISPYGTPKAFKKFIAEPLLYVLAMVSPSSYDGITYGLPPFVHVKAYGNSYMPLAIPQSINFVRNVAEGRTNKYKQPLDITVNVSFEPALPGFAALLNSAGDVKVDVVDDINASSFLAEGTNITGVTSLSTVIESLRPYTGKLNYDSTGLASVISAANNIKNSIDSIDDAISSMLGVDRQTTTSSDDSPWI